MTLFGRGGGEGEGGFGGEEAWYARCILQMLMSMKRCMGAYIRSHLSIRVHPFIIA